MMMGRFRYILTVLLMLACSSLLKGQAFDRLDNTSISMSGGINMYSASNEPLRGASHEFVSLHFAKWLYNPFGARAGLTPLYSINGIGEPSSYFCADFEFLWDPVRCYADIDESQWRSYLYLGAGAVHRFSSANQSGDNDLFLTLGLNVEHRLFANVFGFVELGANVYPADFDLNEDVEAMIKMSMGLNARFHYNPRKPFGVRESPSYGDDWYVGIGLGDNSLVSRSGGILPSPAAELVVGKYFTSVWEARLHSAGIMTGGSGSRISFAGVSANLMCNILNLFVYNRDYLWNLSPYVGAGLLKGFETELPVTFSAEGGLYLRRWLTPQTDLFVDLRGVAFPSRFANMGAHLMATATVGFVYDLGRSTCR